jgi:uncharacterized protein (DUF4213/DUF364 family)
MILEKTVELVKSIYKYHKIIPPKVNRVVIGLGYTGVELFALSYSPFLGLAYTLKSEIKSNTCTKLNLAGKITNKSLTELLDWSYGAPSLQKIIGIATLNAMSQHILEIINPYQKLEEELMEHLKIYEDSKVIFIGQIKPLIQKISKVTEAITIVENNISERTSFKKFTIINDINQLKEEQLNVNILFCTGTALINNTMEEILRKFKKRAQQIVVIGPTASMLPDILFDHGVEIVAGMKIIDSDATIKVLQEAGGTKMFKQYGMKYSLIKE